MGLATALPESLGAIVQTKVDYIGRDAKFEHEKPYDINYDTGEAIPRTNIRRESRPTSVQNFRPYQDSRSLEEYGFCSEQVECSLSESDYLDNAKVEEHYYPAILEVLKRIYPDASDIKLLEHGIRKRPVQFPVKDDSILEFNQPATLVHIDFTPDSASRMAQAAFDLAPHQYRRLKAINIWKPLQGPGNDWPLALCDARTVDRRLGTVAADMVFHNRYLENNLVYEDPRLSWYYFKDLDQNEVIIFRQSDSDLEGGAGVPHTSFHNPHVDDNAKPRMSIEARAYVFF